MGLFALFYTTFVLGVKGYKGIKDSIEDNSRRGEAEKGGKEVYIGTDGVGRNVKDGRKTMYCHQYLNGYNNKPDYVLKYVGTNEIIRNFSQEDREKTERESLQEANINGYTVHRIEEKFNDHFHDECRGVRYKDIKTGAVYVLRRVNGKNFYMDINTGLLVRPTDKQLAFEKQLELDGRFDLKHDLEEILEKFNSAQILYTPIYGLSFRNDLLTWE